MKRLGPVALLAVLSGCAGGGVILPSPGGAAPASANAGFDTGRYPGEAVMRAWRSASPYRWVGYYLSSPCHRDASWMGTRSTLEGLGWGMGVLYVGQQAFEGQPPPPDSVPRERVLCSSTLLTAEQGRTDARDAADKAAAEGFAPGTVIYLDVERMERVAPSMVIYYQAWLDALLADGRYRPGTYAHRQNAAELFGLAQTALLRSGRREAPVFWVAGGSGFGLDRAPSDSGFPFAAVWQGALDVRRSFGGVTLVVDENVADRGSPSAPR